LSHSFARSRQTVDDAICAYSAPRDLGASYVAVPIPSDTPLDARSPTRPISDFDLFEAESFQTFFCCLACIESHPGLGDFFRGFCTIGKRGQARYALPSSDSGGLLPSDRGERDLLADDLTSAPATSRFSVHLSNVLNRQLRREIMADRTTKALLLAIAIGLWMNVASQWLRPARLIAADADTAVIARDLHAISTGSCTNKKIC
jgi:hypothetical protein